MPTGRQRLVAIAAAVVMGSCLVWLNMVLLRYTRNPSSTNPGSAEPKAALGRQIDMGTLQQQIDWMAARVQQLNTTARGKPPMEPAPRHPAAPKRDEHCSGIAVSGKYEGLPCEAAWTSVRSRAMSKARADRWCTLTLGCTPSAQMVMSPELPSGCEGWEFRTKPGQAGTVSASKETATCISCLPLNLPEGLQCVPEPPPKTIGESWAYTNCVDSGALIRSLLLNEKSGKTFVDVGLLDGELIKELARTTDHTLLGFEV